MMCMRRLQKLIWKKSTITESTVRKDMPYSAFTLMMARRDATLTVRDGELVLIPDGYHPVVAAHGYNIYYLNALSGSARSLAASLDPKLFVGNLYLERNRSARPLRFRTCRQLVLASGVARSRYAGYS